MSTNDAFASPDAAGGMQFALLPKLSHTFSYWKSNAVQIYGV
jgi:hypothetical protein